MRLRFPPPGPGGWPRFRSLTHGPGGRPRLRLPALRFAKLLAAVVVAGLGGVALGTALAEFSGDTGSPAGVPPAAPSPLPLTSTSTSAKPADDVLVQIVSATLLPATSPSSKRRQRARISVRVLVSNRGDRRFVVTRPVLVSGNDRVKTDPNQDTAETNLGALAPGATKAVTLRFETAGAVTTRVRKALSVRVIIAGEIVTRSLTVGAQP